MTRENDTSTTAAAAPDRRAQHSTCLLLSCPLLSFPLLSSQPDTDTTPRVASLSCSRDAFPQHQPQSVRAAVQRPTTPAVGSPSQLHALCLPYACACVRFISGQTSHSHLAAAVLCCVAWQPGIKGHAGRCVRLVVRSFVRLVIHSVLPSFLRLKHWAIEALWAGRG